MTKEEVLQLKDAIKKSFTTLLLKSVCITGEIDSKRVDAFKKVMPDVYKAYTKQVTSRRFSIA